MEVPSYICKPPYAENSEEKVTLEKPEIKNSNQIECMAQSCLLAKQILKEAKQLIKVPTCK